MNNFDWGTFIDRTYKLYLVIASRRLRNSYMAEDVVWGVYAKLVDKDYRYSTQEMHNVGIRIVINDCYNIYRKEGKINFVELPASYSDPTYEINTDYNDVLDFMKRELRPDDYVLINMYAAGYKYKELAEHFKIPIGTVSSRMITIRKFLRDSLPEFVC